MSLRLLAESAGVIALTILAFLPWSLIDRGIHELWLTWNGKSKTHSSPR